MHRKERQGNGKSATTQPQVTVAFAEDMNLARQYQQMLQTHQIPVVIKRQTEMAKSGFSDIAIMVPEEFLDEAHSLISQQAAYDDFFDMAFNDPSSEEYNDGNILYDDDEDID